MASKPGKAFAAIEEKATGECCDLEELREVGGGFGVDLYDFKEAAVVLRDFVETWGHEAAQVTGLRVEMYDDRNT